MEQNERQYYCINCGNKTKSLFKKYSETVLKLTECIGNLKFKTRESCKKSFLLSATENDQNISCKQMEKCQQIADKYVEYDLVVIIIDLILLNTQAYRHILLNSEFKNFWKLSVILVLLESYSSWTLSSRNLDNLLCDRANKTEPSLNDFDMNVEDLKFYVICTNVAFGFLCFPTSVYVFTKIYQKYFGENKSLEISFVLILKTITLASAGIFLQLPSIIWDLSLYSYHLHFITLYTCLNQLLAYRVICNCPKVWCLVVIFSSHYFKSSVSAHLNYFSDRFIFIQ